ncbi:hypothetical protein ACJX0J_007046, partial [Zea mays]
MRFPLDVGQPVQGNKDISNSAVTTNYLPYYDIGSLLDRMKNLRKTKMRISNIHQAHNNKKASYDLKYATCMEMKNRTVFGIQSFYSASNWVSYKAFLENAFLKQAWRQTFYFTYLIVSADNAKGWRAVWGNTGDTT